MIIRPSSDIRYKYNTVIDECRNSGEPIYLTKNGHGDAVIMDLVSFKRREQTLHAQELVLEAYVDNLLGARTYTSDEVRLMMSLILKPRQK